MNGYLIFAAMGFCFFVFGVLLYLWAEDRSMRKEFQLIGQIKGEVSSLKRDLELKNGTLSFLMTDRNKMFAENKCLREEVEKLQDLGSSNISTLRELSIRQESIEKQKPTFPSTVEIVFIDKKKEPVSKSKPNERGNNETPKQTPKENRSEATSKGKAGLGRSYKDVERANSRRVSPSRERNKGLNL